MRASLLLLLCVARTHTRAPPKAAPSPYKTLGVAKGASDDEIKAAYRSAALAWHPDKRPEQREEAEAKFKEITAAYHAIKDKASRLVYERDRRQKATPAATPGGPRGELRVPLRVSLEELLRGGSRVCTFELPLSRTQRAVFVLPVTFAAGAQPGDVVETRSHGSTLIHVVLEERPHPVFRRVGEDLHVTKWIQRWSKPTELRLRGLGARPYVPLRFLDEGSGEAVVFRARGKRTHFKSGVRLRKREEGLYARDGLARGDLVVTVKARSARASAAILAARASPFVGVVLALRNATRSLLAAKEATAVAKKHGPKVLRVLANLVTWKRLLDNMQEFAQATPA